MNRSAGVTQCLALQLVIIQVMFDMWGTSRLLEVDVKFDCVWASQTYV